MNQQIRAAELTADHVGSRRLKPPPTITAEHPPSRQRPHYRRQDTRPRPNPTHVTITARRAWPGDMIASIRMHESSTHGDS